MERHAARRPDGARRLEPLGAFGRAVPERAAAWIERLEELVRARPGTTLLAAMAAGFLVGRLIRR